MQKLRRPEKKDMNDIFYDYAYMTQRVYADYHSELNKIADRGCQVLQEIVLFQTIRKKRQIQYLQSQQCTFSAVQQSSNKAALNKKSYTQDNYVQFCNPKFSGNCSFGNKPKNTNIYQQQLSEELENIHFQKENKMPHFNHHDMTLDELIVSAKKSMALEHNDEPESVQQYELTDYSSNQSSNNNNYQQNYVDQEELNYQPLFKKTPSLGYLDGCAEFSNIYTLKQQDKKKKNTFGQQKLKPSNLLLSPIKSQKKRLLMGGKLIPKWAEDPIKAAEANQGMDPTKIFGRCVVQNLNLAYLFGNQQDLNYQRRTSSAKWQYF